MSSRRSSAAVVVASWVLAILVLWPVVVVGETPPSPYWRNTVDFPDDPFCNVEGYLWEISWIKFTILLSEPDRVYFQDSNEYLFHYDFGVEFLEPLLGMSPSEFEAVTLYEAGQEAVLGAVVVKRDMWSETRVAEYGIQFVRQDPYMPEEIVGYFELVRSKVNSYPGVEAYYFPTFEQAQVAEEYADYFSSNGIEVSSVERWETDNSCYSAGWALGTLKYFAGDEIEDAYVAGLLGPGDILLTDAVPAEVPYVAGIISLSASTPNSHVTLLSQSYSIPFAHLLMEEDVARAQSLLGRTVVLRVYGAGRNCEIDLIDVEDELTPQQMGELRALKDLAVLDITPMATLGAYSANADGLTPSDVQYFGGKASNYGFLRREIPNDSPLALAFSFDVWNEFMGQVIPGGLTLREEIDSVLSGYGYPPDFDALADDLDDIRDLIKDDDETHFGAASEAAILAALQDEQYRLDPLKKIRFRSSTNVEDTAEFVGAGLYDSYSGCLADDLDGDDLGPSHCDAEKPKERGVFRAIRKVFASFYNDNAFLERLRYGVNEQDVGMAVLVHHSFPDEIELANGVATAEADIPFDVYSVDYYLVTQVGAVSVTNPEGGAVPETVKVHWLTAQLQSPSSLVQLGATVLEWRDEYEYLADLFDRVAEAYGDWVSGDSFVLDFEYKKVAPGGGALPAGGLAVKQVRQIPQVDDTPSIVPFLVNDPTEFEIFQGEYGDVFSNHRLKTHMRLTTESLWLTGANLGSCFFDDVWMQYVENGQLHAEQGLFSTWPGAYHSFDGEQTVVDGWSFAQLSNPRDYKLSARVETLVSEEECPVVIVGDLRSPLDKECLELTVEYEEPVPAWSTWQGDTSRMNDAVLLCPSLETQWDDRITTSYYRCPDGVTLRATYYMQGGSVLKTRPMRRFVETRIENLTTEPLILTDYFSQTFRPTHHNFGEEFLFEPRLDPGITDGQLAELAAENVRMIHVLKVEDWATRVAYYGADGVRREQQCWKCTVEGDLDCDGDVDLEDYSDWPDCMTGPGGTASFDCLQADVDGDGDVDLADFGQNPFCGGGDMNCDGELDLADYETWAVFMMGPGERGRVGGVWDDRFWLADIDNDGDVDLLDFGLFSEMLVE